MAAGEMNATGTLLSTAATVAGVRYKMSTTGGTNPAGGGATLGGVSDEQPDFSNIHA